MSCSRVAGALTATVIALAAASATGLAQASSAGDDARQRERAGGSSLERVTVTGCVLHEAVYARSTAAPSAVGTAGDAEAEFVIVGDRDGGRREVFSVTGLQEGTLAAYVGRRVEAAGTIEQTPSGAGLPPPGAAGVTPSGSPAHEPSDALPDTVPPSVRSGGDPPSGRAHDADVIDVHALPRLNVVSVRSADGDCEPLASEPPRQDAPAAAPPRSRGAEPAVGAKPAITVPASEVRAAGAGPIEAVGCLVRWTPTGAALTPGPGDLALTRALVAEPAPHDRTSAVPGSQPSGRGSGTVREQPSGSAIDTGPPQRAFLLETSATDDIERLMSHVGERVAIAGVPFVHAGDAANGAAGLEPAHQTAPMERLRVAAFRVVGGHCF